MADTLTKIKAEDVLLSLIYPMTREKMTEKQAAAFVEAVGCQAEYLTSGGAERIRSESVGDVSVTYSDSDDVFITDGGNSIAPEAYSKLKYAGLLVCWI